MRKLCTQIVLILLVLAGVAAAGTPPMQPFTSADGHFSVSFPGTPKQESQLVQLTEDDSATLFQYWVEGQNDNVSYMVMSIEYPPDYVSTPQDMLATARDNAVGNKTLTSDVAISLNGVPGRAFTATDQDGWKYTVHQFLAGDRLYQLIVTSNKGYTPALTGQFMNSFRIR